MAEGADEDLLHGALLNQLWDLTPNNELIGAESFDTRPIFGAGSGDLPQTTTLTADALQALRRSLRAARSSRPSSIASRLAPSVPAPSLASSTVPRSPRLTPR